MTLNTAPNGVGNLWAYSLVSLKKFGATWPELDAITKSANAELEAKKGA